LHPLVQPAKCRQLVKQGRTIDVVPTYGSGTILIAGHQMRGRDADRDLLGQPSSSTTEADLSSSLKNKTTGSVSGLPQPLAVLSLFEHAYVGAEKYGVNGRAEYARDWWNALDWNKIQNRIK
jgi:Fe-Mn family superoxide dismutase